MPKSDVYLLNAIQSAVSSHGETPSIYRCTALIHAGFRVKEQAKELKTQRKEIDQLRSKLETAICRQQDRGYALRLERQRLRRLSDRFESIAEKINAMEAYYSSEEFKQITTREYVVQRILEPGGKQYKAEFKSCWARFAQQCASLRKSQGAGRMLFEMVGLPDMKLPSRSSTTAFKIVEVEADIRYWLQDITLFGINCDGSKRGDRELFEVRDKHFVIVNNRTLLYRS
jgi:hypothetical protein